MNQFQPSTVMLSVSFLCCLSNTLFVAMQCLWLVPYSPQPGEPIEFCLIFLIFFFFLLGSCVSQSLIIFFSRMNSLKLVCVSLSVLPQTGLKLTEDL